MNLLTIGAALFAFVPILFQSNLTPGVDITPAGLLVAATAIAGSVATLTIGVTLRVMDDRFKARDKKREEAAAVEKSKRDETDTRAKNDSKLIDALVIIGQGLRDSNAAQVKEREELRTMLQTKQEASDGRDGAVKAINENTDTKVDALDKKIDTVIETLEEARREAVTKEFVNGKIDPLILKLDTALGEMRTMKAPQPTPASSNGDSHTPPTAIE